MSILVRELGNGEEKETSLRGNSEVARRVLLSRRESRDDQSTCADKSTCITMRLVATPRGFAICARREKVALGLEKAYDGRGQSILLPMKE